MDQLLTHTPPRHREIVRLALVGATGVLIAYPVPDTGIPGLALGFTVVWALCLWLLSRDGLYRPSTAYVVLFGLFHGGLLISSALRGPDAFTAYETDWLYQGYTAEAVRLAVLGMVAFTLVSSSVGDRGAAGPAVSPVVTRPALTVVGLTVEAAGLGVFGMSVLGAGSPVVFSGGYTTYLQAHESDGLLGYGTLLIGVGAILAVVAGGRARIVAWSGFAVYAVVAFGIGTRGAVLFPLLALLAVEARRGRRVRPLWTLLGVPVVLTLIGLVRTSRLGDTSAPASSLWSAPLDAVAEMGYSLRPAVVVLDWHSFGEAFRYGATLFAVPLRFVEGISGWHGGAPVHDTRLFNVEVLDRVGPIGGSPVAEGYHNFGIVGVLLLLGAIGLVIGLLERRPRTPFGDATLGVVLLPLLIQTRNSFAPVPVQIGLALVILAVARLVSRWTADRGAPP